MRIAGIIAEYNPFHDGHAHHLSETRARGADAVVAVMSGSFVQRGEAAILSKFARAEAAVRGGVDLVLELPVYWATGSAQRFAEGAVSVLRQCGCVEMLSFGSECGDADRIAGTARALADPALPGAMQPYLRQGLAFAAARQKAVEDLFGASVAALLRDPNDTLAAEYLFAAARQGAAFTPVAVRRVCAHDADDAQGGFLSAHAIRERMRAEGNCPACPEATREIWQAAAESGQAPADLLRLEREILLRLRTADADVLRRLPDVTEGLENRILTAAKQARSLDELYALVRSKRYPHARVRRIVLSCLLDLRKADIPPDVPYLRPLAIGVRGEEILREIRRSGGAPILSRASQASELSEEAQRVFCAECRAGEAFSLMLPEIPAAGMDFSKPMFRLKIE